MASPVFSLFFVWHGFRLGVPKVVLARMVLNALIDAASARSRSLGDLFDFGWKANAWNLALLERHAMPGRPPTSFDYLFVTLCALAIVTVALIPILLLFAFGAWLRRGYSPSSSPTGCRSSM